MFIFKLKEHKPSIRYYLMKWNGIMNKTNIIRQLINKYNYKNINNNILNTTTDLMKLEDDYLLRDSTNSILNNRVYMNDNYNIDNHTNDENNFTIDDEKILLSIENYSRKNKKKLIKSNLFIPDISKNITYSNTNNINKINKINNHIYKNKFNKINKNKKLKENINDENMHRNSANINNKPEARLKDNNFNKNCYTPGSNHLILSSNNKIKKRIKNNTNILSTENYKVEKNKINSNNMTGKRFKRDKISNKLIEKEIIPFSMINNFEKISKVNSVLSISNKKKSLHNKKLKIYENHIQEYKKLNDNKTQKNKENNYNNEENIKVQKQKKNNNKRKTKINEKNNYFLKKNFMSASIDQLPNINNFIYDNNIDNTYYYKQNQTELTNNNNNTISSFNSSFLNTNKTNHKNVDIRKYLKLWYNKTYYYIIINKFRGLSKIMPFFNNYRKIQIHIFFGNFKIFIYTQKLQEYFNKYKNKIIKNILIKCTIYKVFNKYKEIVFRKNLLKKLREYLIKNQKQIYNEIEKDIADFNKKNYLFNCPRKKVIINNQNQLFININPLNKTNNYIYSSINKSMLNLIHPLDPIYLNNTDNKDEYNFTEENQPFTFNPHNYKKDIDKITQQNQLTMVINLIEQLRTKNKKEMHNNNDNYKNISLLNYFLKWKNTLNNKKIKINNLIHEHTVPTDIEELTQHTINDNIQSESELGTKSDQLTNTISFNNNIIKSNKYVPVRGVKYFHGKKQKQNIFENISNKKYKINHLIDKYKTNTILTKNDGIALTSSKNVKNEYTQSNLNINDNYKTFNDYNSLDYNNLLSNNSDKFMKANNLVKKSTINELQKNQNTLNIYHRKTVGTTFKNNLYSNNNISRINYKIQNEQYINDSISYTLDNYGSNFLGLLNNATFSDYKLEPLILINNNTNNENNYGNTYNNIIDLQKQNVFGFKKLNKIEEKEICFITNKNDVNINLDKNQNHNFNNYNANISIINEIKKYYNEDIDIYNNDEQKKKFNSFIINIFNNNIIMTQNPKTKRSKSK